MRIVTFLLIWLAASSAYALEITGLRIDQKDDGEHVSLRLNQQVDAKVFAVEVLPPRIAVDLPAAHWRGTPGLPADYKGSLVKDVRMGFHDTTTSRIVFDLSTTIQPSNVQLLGSKEGTYWLEFDLASPIAAKAPWYSKLVPSKTQHVSEETPQASQKPMIVIDAGHGGQDPGTSGHAGSHEKNITLSYAHALRDALLQTGRYRVFLTRSDDRYLFLRDRVKRARDAHGDLFISLHADSAPTRSARGLSVYTISDTASDKESAALAAKENKADVIGGMDLSGASPDVADILIDLTERETRARSGLFAELAVKQLGKEVHLLSNTHRFAGFAVLKAPDIPSVLIEVGFLTSPKEEQQLQSRSYQNKIVHAIVAAVDLYYGKRTKGHR